MKRAKSCSVDRKLCIQKVILWTGSPIYQASYQYCVLFNSLGRSSLSSKWPPMKININQNKLDLKTELHEGIGWVLSYSLQYPQYLAQCLAYIVYHKNICEH